MKSYERPNSKWVCGWSHRGFSCRVGPSLNGQCPKRGECDPVKKGDGYVCTRSPGDGGPCEKGPTPDGKCCRLYPPCSPRRSLRARRNMTLLAAMAVTLGVIMVYMGGDKATGDSFFMPGHLSSNHGPLQNNCTSCHSQTGEKNAGSPMAWFFGSHKQEDMSKNCLECHGMGEHPFAAHNVKFKDGLHEGKQCATCHKEHRGEDYKLGQLSDRQCQTCHSQQFASFSNGHPEFENYPFGKKVHILFDHTAHFSQHFEKKGKKVSCQSCHQLQESGDSMALKGFENTCKECHLGQITGEDSINKSVAFFQLPVIDAESLVGKHSVGRWPEDADGEVTGFMKYLIAQKKEGKELLKKWAESEAALDDVSEEDDDVKKLASEYIWQLKVLFNDLLTQGPAELVKSYGEEGESSISNIYASRLFQSMPVDTLRLAAKDWWKGKLADEVEAYGEGKKRSTRSVSEVPENEDDEEWTKNGGWFRDNATFALKYRPKGHADPFLKAWLDLAASQAKTSDEAKAVFEALSHRKESVGSCTKCHGIDQRSDGQFMIRWHGRVAGQEAKDFYHFSHSSHLGMIKEKGCFTCHSINKDADFEKAYKRGGEGFESNFGSISKSTCTQCHGEGQVTQSCTTCHNYHVGQKKFTDKDYQAIKTYVNETDKEEK